MAAQPALASIDVSATSWPITDEQRKETVHRAKLNVSSVGFFNGKPISEDKAEEIATAAEKKAFTAASVASRTTTGERPAVESIQGYVRKLAQLLIEALHQDGTGTREAAQSAGAAAADELDLTGERDFLTTESCEAVLAPLLATGAAHKRIKLSTKSFGHEAAEVAARAIHNVAESLQHADLSDIIAGRPEAEALAVLTKITDALTSCRLHGLDLSDNALGEKGIRAVAKALTSQTGLQHLALRNVGCSVKACAALNELLAPLTTLKSLHLYNNMSGDEGAASIASLLARSSQLEDVQMVSSRVGPEGGTALATALAQGSSLRRLDLHDNPLTAEVFPALGKALQPHKQLRILNLTDTCLTDEGVVQLADALVTCAAQLEELELALNEISTEGAAALAKAVQGLAASSAELQFPALLQQATPMPAKRICSHVDGYGSHSALVTGKQALQKLNLRENELEDKGACLVLSALTGHGALQRLDLSANQLKRAATLAVAKFAASVPTLIALDLDENEFPEDAITQLQEALKAAGKLEALGSLEENMPDEDDDKDDEDGEEDGDAESAALADQLAKKL